MGDIEEIVYSVELPIGTKFYYRNRLYEVVESKEEDFCYSKCAFYDEFWDDPMCRIAICSKSNRHDKKSAFFKEIKEVEEENND